MTMLMSLITSTVAAQSTSASSESIPDWFRRRENMIKFDRDVLGVTTMADDGSLLQAVYNTASQKVLASRRVPADKVPREVRKMHRSEKVAVWQ